ncbi:thermonuclease family protein [Mycolicibacterium alvei]|nr:thermonuclease family protein [Mycolicibacterium alvei]
MAANDRTKPRDIENLHKSRFDPVIHHSPWSGSSICVETKRTGRQVEPAQPHHVDHPTAVNRTLGYLVRADGWDYSVEAARAGMAHAYVYDRRPVVRYDAIAAAANEARQAHRGLWGPPCNGNTDSVPR